YVEIVVAQSNIEFVEHDKADGRVGHEFEGFRPGGFGRGNIAFEVLRLPGKPFAHRMPGNPVAEKRERVLLARMPGALNELHDAHTAPMAEHAKRQAEGSRALAFARTG